MIIEAATFTTANPIPMTSSNTTGAQAAGGPLAARIDEQSLTMPGC
jgi:hypothetical protein